MSIKSFKSGCALPWCTGLKGRTSDGVHMEAPQSVSGDQISRILEFQKKKRIILLSNAQYILSCIWLGVRVMVAKIEIDNFTMVESLEDSYHLAVILHRMGQIERTLPLFGCRFGMIMP